MRHAAFIRQSSRAALHGDAGTELVPLSAPIVPTTARPGVHMNVNPLFATAHDPFAIQRTASIELGISGDGNGGGAHGGDTHRRLQPALLRLDSGEIRT